MKLFNELFYPVRKVYSYPEPIDTVKRKVREVLAKGGSFLGEPDLIGRFIDGCTFIMRVPSPAFTHGVRYGSTMIAEIKEGDSGKTLIEVRTKPAIAVKLMFFVTILMGIVYLYQFIRTSSTDFLLWSIAILFLGPLVSLWIAGMSNATVYDRYGRYIHKALKNLPSTK